MKKIQLVQLNNSYGDQVYLPYSVGMLAAYANKSEKVKSSVKFQDFIFLRESIDKMVEKVGDADILGVSCYVWNWELSVRLAEAVKKKNSNCLILFGGPHVPDHDDSFFEKYPYIDIACHGEGEVTFLEILEKFIDGKPLTNICGTTFNENCKQIKGLPRARIKDLDTIPSPYLEGTFDSLLKDNSYKWMVTWETNRGCPFKCSFCDWGSAIATKVRKFSEERLFDEIKYFSDNKIDLVFGADANFGIFKRDKDFALKLAEYKTETGWPNQFRVCFTKNSTDKIFELAKIFADAGMNKGVSVSMQSMNPQTLKDIQRANIRLNVFKELQKKYVAAGLVTYTELILPLPGETYDTFVGGVNELLDSAQHSGIVIYNCTVMPNAEMGSPEYQKKHGFDMVTLPIFQAHSTPKNDEVVEKETVIVGTGTMPREEWRKTFKFAWAVQCFHLLGLLQPVSIVLRHRYGVEYGDFYSRIIEYFENKEDTIVGSELQKVHELITGVFSGNGFDQYVHDFLNVSWPAEEASFLRISNNLDLFYKQIHGFIEEAYPDVDKKILLDTMKYQRNIIVSWQDTTGLNCEFSLDYDIHSYFNDLRAGKVSDLLGTKKNYKKVIRKNYANDKQLFSREVVWYGRKGGKFFNEILELA
tara:strand:+ start:155 stop:2083 length:1929 start_codon:yes stop_codon:yes gene_type:complete